MQVMKNLVIGGVDIHLREHNQKGFRVKESRNLHFNNGHIQMRGCLHTFQTLVAAGGATLYDGVLSNKVL